MAFQIVISYFSVMHGLSFMVHGGPFIFQAAGWVEEVTQRKNTKAHNSCVMRKALNAAMPCLCSHVTWPYLTERRLGNAVFTLGNHVSATRFNTMEKADNGCWGNDQQLCHHDVQGRWVSTCNRHKILPLVSCIGSTLSALSMVYEHVFTYVSN